VHGEGERGGEGKRRVPLTPVGTGVALAGVDAVAVLRTAAGTEVDDGAYGCPFVSGRERESEWEVSWATATAALLGWLAWEEEGRREGRREWAAVGQKGGRGRK
jgi:hypothetical protein